MMYLTGCLVFVGALQTWFFWRMAVRLRALPRLEERVSALHHSMTLLTDTTEGCFLAIAAQLQGEGGRTPAAPRAARQKRIVTASRRGGSVRDIAAAEEVSESEVGLRLHLQQELGGKRGGTYGALRV